MKVVGSLLLVSVLLGAGAALAAAAIGVLTAATVSPWGGALLGAAFGLSGGRVRAERIAPTLIRAVLAGGTAALVVAFLQRR